jgi:hypothetical protein
MRAPIYFISFLIIVSSCHKPCMPRQFTLNGGTVSISPDKDSIHVGDTLWFICSVPANLKYYVSNISDSGSYNITGATNFRTDFHLTTPVGVGLQDDAIDSFSFILGQGSAQPEPLAPGSAKTISFALNSDKYIVSFGMVAKKKGIYVLIILDIYQAMIDCDKLSVTILMNNIDEHLHYLQDIYFGGQPIDALDATHSYCFKVY